MSLVWKGKEAQTLNSEGEVGENVWPCLGVKYLSSVSPQFLISPHMLNIQGVFFVFFCYRKSKDFSEAVWQSVVAGCNNGTHFSMCAGSVLWVPSMTLFLNQSYKTPVVVCFFVFVFISEVILYLILPVWFVSNFILALNILLHCGQTQGNYIIFLFSL